MVLSVPFIHRWQRGPSGHFTALHFTTRGRNKTARPRGRRRGVERPAVPERRRGRAAPLPHGRLEPGPGPGRPPEGRGAHAPPAPAAAPRSPAVGGGGAGPAAAVAGYGSARRRPRASGRPAGPDPLASSSAPARRAADFSAGASTQRRRRPLKRMWSARQLPASCGRRPWRGLRKRRLRLAALLPPARFPPQPPPGGCRHRRSRHLRASRTQDGRLSASFAASGCRK